MSATLTFDDLSSQTSALPEAVSIVSSSANAVTEKPSFFARMLDAIGRAYYVPTPDGQGIYVFPPV